MRGVALCSLVFLSVAIFAARPERNAFVDFRVKSIANLEHQLRTDPAVRNRYERHFSMSQARLFAFIGTLHRDVLHKASIFTVYSVPVDGHVKMHLQRFKPGEPVFADRNGSPVLLVKCGNPLTLGPDAISGPAVDASPADDADNTLKVASIPGVLDTESPEMLLATPSPAGDTVFVPEVPETLTGPGVGPAEAPQSFAGGGGGSGGSGVLPFLPILGGIVYGIGSSGGHHGPAPVPEPMSFIPLGLGVAGVLIRHHKKRRSTLP